MLTSRGPLPALRMRGGESWTSRPVRWRCGGGGSLPPRHPASQLVRRSFPRGGGQS